MLITWTVLQTVSIHHLIRLGYGQKQESSHLSWIPCWFFVLTFFKNKIKNNLRKVLWTRANGYKIFNGTPLHLPLSLCWTERNQRFINKNFIFDYCWLFVTCRDSDRSLMHLRPSWAGYRSDIYNALLFRMFLLNFHR